MPGDIFQAPKTVTAQCAAPAGEFVGRIDCCATHGQCKAGFTDLPVKLQAFAQFAQFNAWPEWIVTIGEP